MYTKRQLSFSIGAPLDLLSMLQQLDLEDTEKLLQSETLKEAIEHQNLTLEFIPK